MHARVLLASLGGPARWGLGASVGWACLFSSSPTSAQAGKNATPPLTTNLDDRHKCGKIEVNGVKLFVVQAGESGPPILCMPGALGTALTDFKPQLDGLCDEFQVVSHDPRGYGQSQPPIREFPSNFYHVDADDAAGVMQALGHDRFSVIGWSDGANSAVLLAAKYPERVEKLVLVAGNAYNTEADITSFEKTRDVVSSFSPRMLATLRPVYGDQLQPMWSGFLDAMIAIAKSPEGDICRSQAKQLTCPVLIVHGAKDPLVRREHPEYFQSVIPNCALYVFDEGKHNPHLRFAAEFNQLVADFFCRGLYPKPSSGFENSFARL